MTDRIIKHDRDTYYRNAIIKEPPNQAYIPQTKRIIRLVVDSRERNISLFPNPNSYEVNILEDVRNVETLSLISVDFPFDPYTVGIYNNMLYLAYNDTVYNVSISIGNYEPTELASALQTAMNNTTNTSAFVVEYNTIKDNFTFRCSSSFGMIFRGNSFVTSYNNSADTAYAKNSMGKLLGFGINNYVSVVRTTGDSYVNVINSEFKKDFVTKDYLVLNIESFDLNKSTVDSIQNSFAIITKSSESLPYGTEFVNKKFKPYLNMLKKLKINIVDFYNNPYDFQNKDHRFELLLLCDF